jgi:hypothetical protein
MKPKTKLQVRIMSLSQSLPAVSDIEKEWSNNNHKKYFVRHYKNFVCLECNYKWRTDLPEWIDSITESHCPNCKNEIELIKHNKPIFNYFHIFSIVTTAEEFQVVRYFTTWKNMSKNNTPNYHTVELYQEWDTDYTKKTVIVGLNKSGSYYYDGFSYGTNFDIKNAYDQWGNYSYSINPDFVYPEVQVLPIFYRNGFDGDFRDCCPRAFLKRLIKCSVFETLVKMKHEVLIDAYMMKPDNVMTTWKQILICLKHNFEFTDFSIWYDYIDFLRYFNLDINNPRYICPKNLLEAHNFYLKKKNKREEVLRKKRQKEDRIKEQKKREMEAIALKLKTKHFKNFKIKEDEFEIVVLTTAKEFKKEGETLNHCVYASSYHTKKDSLILSARINNEPIETIEISLSRLEIIQIRGYDNEPTDYHDKILKIMKSNLPKIGSIIKKHQNELSKRKAA